MDGKAALGSGFFLVCFNGRVVELLYVAALQADDVVVVFTLIEFEHRFAALKMVSYQQPRLFELGQYAVNGCQTHIVTANE